MIVATSRYGPSSIQTHQLPSDTSDSLGQVTSCPRHTAWSIEEPHSCSMAELFGMSSKSERELTNMCVGEMGPYIYINLNRFLPPPPRGVPRSCLPVPQRTEPQINNLRPYKMGKNIWWLSQLGSMARPRQYYRGRCIKVDTYA